MCRCVNGSRYKNNCVTEAQSGKAAAASRRTSENLRVCPFPRVQQSGNKPVLVVAARLSSSYLLACGAYRKMALKVERISLDPVVASWPSVFTSPTRSPFLRGRMRLKDAEPPQAHSPGAKPTLCLGELCSLWMLRLDTDRTACTRSPFCAVSSPETR